jgi:hypothetical protein
VAFAGCIALCVSDVSLWFVLDGYSPARETISDLAAGTHSWVADSGIVAFAIGILALAAGLTLHDDADARSWLVRAAMLVTAFCFLVLALWNEYGDASPGGLIIHPYVAGLLGVSVAIVLWFAPAPSQEDRSQKITRRLRVQVKTDRQARALLSPIDARRDRRGLRNATPASRPR